MLGRQMGMNKSGEVALRFLERLVASMLLLLLLPPLAIIALVIRATSDGPVVLKDQGLSGTGGVAATYCFRTTGRGSRVFAAVGEFLRGSSLDHLPSIWGVATGELRFRDLFLRGRAAPTGPRPTTQWRAVVLWLALLVVIFLAWHFAQMPTAR